MAWPRPRRRRGRAEVLALRAAPAAALSLLAASLLVSGGCYKPLIKSGGLQCAMPGNLCPDDFKCDTSQVPPVCITPPPGAGGTGGATGGTQGKGGSGGGGMGGKAGAPGTGGKIGTGGAGGTGGTVCLTPVSNCTTTYVDGGACDPVCNVGCGSCDKKCSVNSAGARTCNAPVGTLAGLMKSCLVTQTSGNPSTQTDNCGPGQVCLEPSTCGAQCYQFCRNDLDCPSQNCGRDLGNGLKACDVPLVNCDPSSYHSVRRWFAGRLLHIAGHGAHPVRLSQ